MTDGRSGGYLALVCTGVLSLWISYFEDPFICMKFIMHRLETLIARISVSTNCQQMNITMPHPRDLKQAVNHRFFISAFKYLTLFSEYDSRFF